MFRPGLFSEPPTRCADRVSKHREIRWIGQVEFRNAVSGWVSKTQAHLNEGAALGREAVPV